MGKERTEKSRYSSRYSPSAYVTGPQYILELICERKAKRENIDLPIKFWNLPDHQRHGALCGLWYAGIKADADNHLLLTATAEYERREILMLFR